MAQPQTILVLGAGELGHEVIQSLIGHPARGSHKITLVLRNSAINTTDEKKLAQLKAYKVNGIDFLAGDLVNDDVKHIATLFAPYETVISCTGMTFPPGTHKKIARAALEANVRRFFPWQFGCDYDVIGQGSAQNLFDEQLEVRAMLRAQGHTQWVIVSVGMFMSFLFEPAFGLVQIYRAAGKFQLRAPGSVENNLTLTTVEDIGRVVAELALVDKERNGVVHVAGDTIAWPRIVDEFRRVTSLEGNVEEWSLADLQADVQRNPGDTMAKYRTVWGNVIGTWWPKEGTFNDQKGMKTISLVDYLEKNWAMM